jgi:succinyl-CoA synthetase beta subunit
LREKGKCLFSLTEDQTKEALKAAGLPVPDGRACATADDAAAAAEMLGGTVVVKALVPTGRRGKVGAVKMVATVDDARAAAAAMLGTEVHGYPVEQVYVEATVDIAEEYYLSFSLDDFPPKILISRHGGVDIESTSDADSDAVVQAEINPIGGFGGRTAAGLWHRTGLVDTEDLGALAAALYDTFVAKDAVMMEINPLARLADGSLSLVGAMMGIDENGLPRQPEWEEFADGSLISTWRRFNERERMVAEVNRRFKGGAIRYTELDGDIGLFVGGGGAGLLMHDQMLAAGGRPANHTDSNPGAGAEEKYKAVYRAVFDNPATNCLLVAGNYLQLTDCRSRIEPLLEVMDERGIDARDFPIVIRIIGPGEQEARDLVVDRPGFTYLPFEATMEDGVRAVVEINAKIVAERKAPAS